MAAVEKRKGGAPKGSNRGNTNGKATRGMPRTAHLTRKVGRAIVEHVATGTPKTFAAQAEGVSYAAMQEWVRRGEGKDDRPPTELTRWFATEMRKAEARDVNRRKKRLDAIAESGDPRVDMWWLERRHPEEFGRVDRHEVTGEGGGPVTIRLAFDPTPIPAKTRAELGGPVIDVEGVEET